jgi:Ca-activated chloride channel homolog
MTSENTMIKLPDAPSPSNEKREAAISNALRGFDQFHHAHAKGGSVGRRLMQRTAISPRRSSPMPRARQLIAASLVCLLAGSAAWVYVKDRPGLPGADRVVVQPAKPPAAPQPPAQQTPPSSQPALTSQVVQPAPSQPQPPARAEDEAQRSAARSKEAQMLLRQERRLAENLQHSAPLVRSVPGTASMPPPRPIEPGQLFEPTGRDKFAGANENGFKIAREAPVSTFSIDVDTASYSFTRAALNRNVLPPPASVRTEELINYFPYAYEPPRRASEPFSVTASVFPSPWSEGRKLMRIGIKGYEVQAASRPRANIVLLIDTSGSMNAPNRLPLVKQSLSMLLTQLKPDDRVAIVTYAGKAGTVLEPTLVSEKNRIAAAIEALDAGDSTAGGEGIRQAYALAERNLEPNAVNRVILATDGDFNVGITNTDELKGFVERERGKGIFLSVLGFGMGNYNDALMQALAQNGNGVAAYIDTVNEARKVLVEEATSSLIPIAKDVKIQVEFNPAVVAEYRLVGYETRLLNRDDFNNDKVDAGEVGSGQSVTALYEIVPVGGPAAVADLRYGVGNQATPQPSGNANEYAFVKLRYKLPQSDTSALISMPVQRSAEHARFEDAPLDARFATAVGAFGEILRGGKHTAKFSYDDVLRIATPARGDDPYGYRSEFLQLVRAAKTASAMPAQPR